MRILRARLKPYGGSSEFISVASKIKSLIDKNPEDNFHFVIYDNGGNIKNKKTFYKSII